MEEKRKSEIYFEMYKQASLIENLIRDRLRNWKIYNLEVYVGKEETKEYQIYFEGIDSSYKYMNIIGLFTLDIIYELFNL